ncbi:Zinc finger protein 383 [Pyrenophora tritici-repentis]|nr:Zinc finger protein 383 [Pyrenophora tritici-repentis]KAI0613544.1 Zinc finger protein 383 [Pyrenophora tritici-repentis]KAI0625540.1 Zinc finger protein 383 [Pyrenophora tritici-repentis]
MSTDEPTTLPLQPEDRYMPTMANNYVDCDHDSAFGDDDDFGTIDPMLSPHPVAGTKREACELGDDAQKPIKTTGPGREHLDSQTCCKRCPEPCPDAYDMRPAKRKASVHKVGEYHHNPATELHEHIEPDCPFPDDCFEKFCQECIVDPPCPSDCSLPCPANDCPRDDTCFDPRCTQGKGHCTDDCVDPGCTKATYPEESCFCQKCNAKPCPLGDPNSECHFAHSAPTPVGTVYCYDTAPCHFQHGLHGHDNDLSSFETYPCFSQTHGYNTVADDLTTATSSAPTPALSHSNYTSLESNFTMEPSPAPGQTAYSPYCFLNVSGDHCHIDNSCCHGPGRRCADAPSATQQQLDLWNSSIASGNGLANNFMNFGFNPSLPTSPMSADRKSIHSNHYNLDNSISGFNDNSFNESWMLPELAFPHTLQPEGAFGGANKLDFLASAIQNDLLRPDTTTSVGSGSMLGLGSSDAQTCVCKWQHAPGLLCLAIFDSPSALHKHIKTAHVDNCTHCTCQWEGCDASTKDFKQRSKLSRHLLGHAGYRPYACSIEGCDKTFATNQAKDNHERTHTGERPYMCERCGYTTTTHTQLQTHISALHEGKKPHKCRFCSFTCADSSNLSKHERTHQTLRPYRCPHPNCTFKPDCRWENLKRHLRRSGHCPELLVDDSIEYKSYREGVRREIDDWHKRNVDEGKGKTGRRKSRA